ncbi:MAG: isochorismatase family protein [Polyangiales bacterium]
MNLINPLDPAESVLLLVDIQERLLGAMSDAAATRVVRVAETLLIGAAALEVPVVISEQYPKGLGPTAPSLLAHFDGRAVAKTVFDASEVPEIQSALQGRRQVIVAGMEAHICVHQTVRGLKAQGFEVTVASDATCSRSDEHQRLAEGLWRESGASVSCGEAVLFDWLGKAGGDAFKIISKAIR